MEQTNDEVGPALGHEHFEQPAVRHGDQGRAAVHGEADGEEASQRAIGRPCHVRVQLDNVI
eukprot:1325993-Pyramimonas_sp.AAC.1